MDVCISYIKLGQPYTQLSGGEAQSIKLATEQSKRPTGRTLYILDEPTTGLHSEDVRKLIEVLQRLADTGNTVVVIELFFSSRRRHTRYWRDWSSDVCSSD